MEKTLLIADDHTLFRETLEDYLQRSEKMFSILSVKDYSAAQEVMMSHGPQVDLVILDLCMPGMNGLEGLEKFRKQWPQKPVAIMSGVAEIWEVESSLEKGAVGFFPKTMSGKALINAIDLVLSGERYIPADYTPPPQRPGKPSVEMEKLGLTRREHEVLRHLLRGAANKDIAHELGLQIVTVKLHIRGIFRKLDVKNRTQAVLRAKELGLHAD